jgi:hypothetical protein
MLLKFGSSKMLLGKSSGFSRRDRARSVSTSAKLFMHSLMTLLVILFPD